MLTLELGLKIFLALVCSFGGWWILRRINKVVDKYLQDNDNDVCWCRCEHCKKCIEWERD